jgi:NAD(P)-dependent dehydrogenase (short-subunit alcohol dehydrogenase family)
MPQLFDSTAFPLLWETLLCNVGPKITSRPSLTKKKKNRLQASIGNGEDSRQRLRQVEDSLPMKRVCQPVDIANAAWYLGSEESSFVTGTTLEVDGGRGV